MNPYPLTPHVHKQWIIDQIRELKPKTVLDVGCAGGTGLWFYHQEFPDIKFIGIDKLAENVNDREQWFDKNVKFELGDILDIPFKDKSFDLVICDSVINTLNRTEDKQAIKELMRVAKKNILFLEQNGTENDFISNNYAHDYKQLLPDIQFLFKVTGYGDPHWDEFGYLMRLDK